MPSDEKKDVDIIQMGLRKYANSIRQFKKDGNLVRRYHANQIIVDLGLNGYRIVKTKDNRHKLHSGDK